MCRPLALALVLLAVLVAPARPQVPPAPTTPTPPVPVPTAPVPEADRAPEPLVWGVAILGTLVILFIVCTPTRKG